MPNPNDLEPNFPGFAANPDTFHLWALKGIVRSISRVTEAPTQEQWDKLRETLTQTIDEIDTFYRDIGRVTSLADLFDKEEAKS